MKDRIKHLRKIVLDMSLEKFGEKVGLGAQAIAAIEKGRNELTERNFNAICKAFDVNPDWLRNGVGEIFLESKDALVQQVAEEFGLNKMEMTLIRTFLDLEPEQRQGVMTWITAFAKTMAVQMGIEYRQPVKPDSELTRPEMHETLDNELDARDDARKRGITTSSASIGSNGSSKKISKSLE